MATGTRGDADSVPGGELRSILTRQYHASLAMLREAVSRCPEPVWAATATQRNAFWQIAYHALYYTHLYLCPDESSFRPWHGHQGNVQHPDGLSGPSDPDDPRPPLPRPYTRDQVLDYLDELDAMVDSAVHHLDLSREESGFWWYRMSKLEHQMVNLRHVQHHAAQLIDRLRSSSDVGVAWVSTGEAREEPK